MSRSETAPSGPSERRHAAGQLRWLAAAAACADYMENVSNSVLLAFYPGRFPLLASVSGLLTLMKFSLSGVCILIALSMLVIVFAEYQKMKT